MKSPRIFLALVISLVCLPALLFAQSSKQILSFDAGANQWVTSYQANGAAANNIWQLSDNPDDYVEGSGSIQMNAVFRGYGASWGGWTDARWTFPVPMNLSGYDDIRFNMKIVQAPSHIGTKVAGSRALQFVIDVYDSVAGDTAPVLWRYCEGTGDMNIYYYPHDKWITPTDVGWFEVVIPFSALRTPSWAYQGDGIYHGSNVVTIGFGADGDSTAADSVQFLIDNLRATKKESVVQLTSMDGPASAWTVGLAATTPPNKAEVSDNFDDYVEGSGSMLFDIALRAMVASWGTWTDIHYRPPQPINATGATELRFSYKVLTPPANGKDIQLVFDLFDSSAAGPGGPWRWSNGYGQYGLFANGLGNVNQNTWTEVAIPMIDLTFPSWAPDPDGSLNLENIIGLSIGLDGDSSGTDSVRVLFDNVYFSKQLGTTGVNERLLAGIPGEFRLEQNYPNPFNPSTRINFTLPQADKVSLKIFNVTGQLVETVLDNAEHVAGKHQVDVNMNRLASGAYFYVLQAGANRQAKMMMLLK